MKDRIKILFICTYNMMRSKTAEVLYREDERFKVKSAGVSEHAEVRVDGDLLAWADFVVVMEEFHRQWIDHNYTVFFNNNPVLCLNIADMYDFMDPELVPILKQKFESLYREKMESL